MKINNPKHFVSVLNEEREMLPRATFMEVALSIDREITSVRRFFSYQAYLPGLMFIFKLLDYLGLEMHIRPKSEKQR